MSQNLNNDLSSNSGGDTTNHLPKPPKSFVTWGLCLIMLVIWVATLLAPTLIRDFAFMPAIGLFEPWRFLTAAFLHSIPMPLHVGFNCWALWVVGRALEPLLGHVKLLVSFVICAVSASLACCVWTLADPNAWLTVTVGASGAVFGFFGIMLAIQKLLHLPATEMAVLIGINLVIGFVFPNVSWQAHLGGLLAGLLIGVYTSWRLRHATLVEIPVLPPATGVHEEPVYDAATHEVPPTPADIPRQAVVLHRIVTTRDRIFDAAFYLVFLAALIAGNWLFYHLNYQTIYSLLGL